MAVVKKVVVLGGGIGGLTLAHCLERAGIRCRVIESGNRGDRLGTGISLLGNALRALDMVGLAQECIEQGYGWETVQTHDSTGKLLNEMKSPRTFKPDAPSAVGIMRTRLAELLEKHAEASGAVISHNTIVKSIDQKNDGVALALSDGTTEGADLVVAADGAYSSTRSAVFGSEFKPAYTGQGGWRYTTKRPESLKGFVIYRHGRLTVGGLPLSNDLCYYFFLENIPEHVRMPAERLGEMFKDRLASYTAPELRRALDEMTPSSHISYRPYDVILMPNPWHQSRVVLLGDAAHTLAPQLTSGGGMAIEDAVVLTEELSRAATLDGALQAYGDRRMQRVKPLYDISLQICKLEQDPATAGERSLQLLMQGYGMLAAPF